MHCYMRTPGKLFTHTHTYTASAIKQYNLVMLKGDDALRLSRYVCMTQSEHNMTRVHDTVGLAPTYLVDDCHAISAIAGKRHLRSADNGTLFVPRTTTTLGMRSFAVAGPRIWNSLPAALRTATLSPLTFARHLKSHLFDWLTAPLKTI